MYARPHVKGLFSVTNFNQMWIFSTNFSQPIPPPILNLMKICLMGEKLFHMGERADGRTWQSQQFLFATLGMNLKYASVRS